MCGKSGVLFFVALLSAGKQPAAAGNRSIGRTVRANVRFLATSSSVRSDWGGNEDIYLAEIEFNGTAREIGLAWLIDEYPPYRVSIPASVLTSASANHFRLARDRSCDLALGLMPLRTAPGDPMAILPEPLHFQPDLPEPVGPAEVIPCYRVIRR